MILFTKDKNIDLKKIKRYLRQRFCKHSWIEIRDPATDEFIRECEREYVPGSSYAYTVELQCTKCGKITYEGSGQII
jgi:hypothetical protein